MYYGNSGCSCLTLAAQAATLATCARGIDVMLLQQVLHCKPLSALISSYEWIDHDGVHASKKHEPRRCTHTLTMLAAGVTVMPSKAPHIPG